MYKRISKMSEKQTINTSNSDSTEYSYVGILPAGPEALNYGFSIDMQPEYSEGVPLDAAIANSGDVLDAIEDSKDIRLIGKPDERHEDEEVINVYATLLLKREDIEASHPDLAQKIVGKHYLDEVEIADSGALDVYEEEIKDMLYDALVNRMRSEFDSDFIYIPSEIMKDNPQLLQVFEFESDGKMIRLYNFSKTKVTKEQLAKLTNAIREMAQVTGGVVFDKVPVMAIAPSNLPWFGKASAEAQSIGGSTVNAYALGTGAIVFNEELLAANDGADNSFSVGGNDIEYVAFHELSHAVSKGNYNNSPEADFAESIGWKFEKDSLGAIDKTKPIIKPDVSAPSRYGSITPGEDLAESATARFAGGDWEDAVSIERKDGVEDLYKAVHTGFIGPVYIRCAERDLRDSQNKIGLEYSGKKVALLPHVQISIN